MVLYNHIPNSSWKFWKVLLSIPRGAFCIKQDGIGRQLGGREREVSVLTMKTKYRVHVEHK